MAQSEMEGKIQEKSATIKRVGGVLHRVIPIADQTGKVISYALKPLMVEFKPRDVIQVGVGAALLAIPVSLTEEAWNLGASLPLDNIVYIALLSLAFISIFVFFNYYRTMIRGHVLDFLKRVLGTYIISMLVVAMILTLIEKCPWGVDNILAIKRVVIVAFPAAMSGTLSDTIK